MIRNVSKQVWCWWDCVKSMYVVRIKEVRDKGVILYAPATRPRGYWDPALLVTCVTCLFKFHQFKRATFMVAVGRIGTLVRVHLSVEILKRQTKVWKEEKKNRNGLTCCNLSTCSWVSISLSRPVLVRSRWLTKSVLTIVFNLRKQSDLKGNEQNLFHL